MRFIVCALWAAVLAAVVGGCTADVSVPAGAQIGCQSDADCPADFVCGSSGRCVSARGDREPPVIREAQVDRARVRTEARVTFKVSEPVAGEPVVTAAGYDRTLAFALVSRTDEAEPTFVYGYTVAADDPNDTYELAVSLADVAGNRLATRLGAAFAIDTVGPQLSAATPELSLRGDQTLVLTLSSTEPLTTPPVLAVDRPGLELPPPEVSGTSYTWRKAIARGVPDGTFKVSASAADVAGNPGALAEPVVVRIDATAPQATAKSVAPQAAVAGTKVAIAFTTSERLGRDANVRVGQDALPCPPTAAGALTFACTYTVTAGDGVRSVAAELEDVAGNFAVAPLGDLAVDSTAPVVTSFLPSPSPAPIGARLTLALTVNEDPAAGFPKLHGPPGFALAGPTRAGRTFTWTHDVAAGDPASVSFTADVEDALGNHADAVPLTPAAVVDATLPNVALSGSLPAKVKAGDRVTATFTVDEDLADDPAVNLGGVGFALVSKSKDAVTGVTTWVFDHPFAAGDAEGSAQRLNVTVRDSAGNVRSMAVGSPVAVDVTPPVVRLAVVPKDANLSQTIAVTLNANEPLGATPDAVATHGAATIAGFFTGSGSGTAFGYTSRALTSSDDGAWSVAFAATDAFGNTAAPVAATFNIDALPPVLTAMRVDKPASGGTLGLSAPYNDLAVHFETDANLGYPSPLLDVLADGVAFTACSVTASGARFAYDCTLTVTSALNVAQDGVIYASVAVRDAARNVATWDAPVFVDSRPPTAAFSATPARAPLNGKVALTLTSDEPLASAPTLTVQKAGAPVTGFFGAPSGSGTSFTWTSRAVASGDDGAWSVSATASDARGNTAAAASTATFDVDTVAPVVSSASVVRPAAGTPFGSKAPYNHLEVQFTLDEQLTFPSAQLEVRADDLAFASCTVTASVPPAAAAWTYLCKVDVDAASAADGVVYAGVTARDGAGNVRLWNKAVFVDATPPAIAGLSQLLPPNTDQSLAADRVRTPSPGPTLDVAFTVTEALKASPAFSLRTSGGSASPLQATAVVDPVLNPALTNETFFQYRFSPPSGVADSASLELVVTLVDAVENASAPLLLGTLVFDSTPPAFDVTKVVYRRAPWGGTGLPQPAGAPGTTPVYDVLLNQTLEADSRVTITDPGGTLLASVRTAGQAPPARIALLTPASSVLVRVSDQAGNFDAATATAVHNGEWVAAFGNKQPGSTAQNPHAAFGVDLLTDAREPQARFTKELTTAEYQGVAIAGDTTAQRQAPPADHWVNEVIAPNIGPADGRVAYDPVRKKTFMFGDYFRSDVWEWNGARWAKTNVTGAVPGPRASPVFVWDARLQKIVMFGGEGFRDSPNSPCAGTSNWQHTLPSQVSSCSASYTVSGVGVSHPCGCALSDTWTFDGTSWAQLTPAGGPPFPRLDATAGYDAANARLVIHGGQQHKVVQSSGSYSTWPCPAGTSGYLECLYGDTWQLTASGWSQLPGTSPGARVRAGMGTLPSRGTLGLFGGRTEGVNPCPTGAASTLYDGCVFNDVWELGATSWSKLNPVGTPPPGHHSFGFAADPARSALAIFGGGGALQPDDQWELTASGWGRVTRADPEGDGNPTTPLVATLATDTDRGRLVLVQADNAQRLGNSMLHETWEWDGTSWERRAVARLPSAPRFAAADVGFAIDAARRRGAIVGGSVSSDRPIVWDGSGFAQGSAVNAPTDLRGSPLFAYMPQSGTQSSPQLFMNCGRAANGYTASPAYDFDGQRWTSRNAVACNGTYGIATSYDTDLLRLMNVSGVDTNGNTFKTNAGYWDGTTYTSVAALSQPRAYAAAAYDPLRKRHVVFGGVCGSGTCNTTTGETYDFGTNGTANADVYEYSATTNAWTHTNAQNSPSWPSPRAQHSAIWDPVRQRVLFVGGRPAQAGQNGGYACDGMPAWCEQIWGWNGSTFTKESFLDGTGDGEPALLRDVRVAEDPTRGTLVYAPTSGQLWTYYARPDARRPGVLATFDLAALPEPLSSATAVDVVAVAGGTGSPGGSPAPGAQLQVWNETTRSWVTLASNGAPLGSPAQLKRTLSSSSAPPLAQVLGGTAALRVRVTPAAENGPEPARASVAVDDLFVDVKTLR